MKLFVNKNDINGSGFTINIITGKEWENNLKKVFVDEGVWGVINLLVLWEIIE